MRHHMRYQRRGLLLGGVRQRPEGQGALGVHIDV